jgi:DNA polymerase-1
VIKLLLEWRKAEKFVTSFGESVLERLNPVTHRIHPDWQQIGADSDRTSCKRPNLQQIPSRTTTGKRLRHCVQADDGALFVDADFSSQELVILAFLSGEPEMLEAFKRGEDLHARTAMLMFDAQGVDTRTYLFQGLAIRDIAKQINYGIAYGMTKYRLGKLLHIGYDEAQELIDKWYASFPVAKAWLDKRKAQVDRGQWYSRTLHGWVRRYEPMHDSEPIKPRYGQPGYQEWKERHQAWEMERNELMNQMMNTPMQGSGAGMTKLALTLFFERAIMKSDNGYSIKPKIAGAFHDELLIEVPDPEYAEVYRDMLADCMNEAEAQTLPGVVFPKAEAVISKYWEH